jgi:L-threonylcarbamoyladenylate synthase
VKTRILLADDEALELAAETLRTGGLVAIPTETVYGLAGSAWNEHAVATIFAAKERPTFDPLIVHVASPFDWGTLSPSGRFEYLAGLGVFDATPLSAIARKRIENLVSSFWPGPLSLVLPRSPRIPFLVTSGLDTVAVRMPDHRLAQSVLRRCGLPLAAPSANRFGRISPTEASDVLAELEGRIPLILDGGSCAVGIESTVIEIECDGRWSLLRPGGLPVERVAEVAGTPSRSEAPSGAPRVASPGTLDSHYAPTKPLFLLPGPLENLRDLSEVVPFEWVSAKTGIGVLSWAGLSTFARGRLERWAGCPVTIETLSPRGDTEEAARRLFGALRALDREDSEYILAEPCPTERGLGHAIADRLRRASAR